jgi:hypothetical protein
MIGHYAFCPTSPWWLKLCPSKWFSLGMDLLQATPLKSHCTVPDHTYHFPSLFLSISLSLVILGCIDPRRGCPSFYGKKGLKAVKCMFIGYKEGMKGYKLWDPASRKTMYNRDVVFREVRSKSEPKEIVQIESNPEMVRFELRNEEDELGELTGS